MRFTVSILSVLLAIACAEAPTRAPSDTAAAPTRPVDMRGKADGATLDMTTPWGGADPAQWTPEAVLANAAQAALAEPGVVRVAIPVKMLGSAVHPFGDGQSNASAVFPWWSAARPPVVAHLTDAGAVQLVFDAALGLEGGVAVRVEDGAPQELSLVMDADGHQRAEWTPDFDPARDRLSVRPVGWSDAFPIWFHHPVTSAARLADSVPDALRPDGALPDLANVGARARREGTSASDVLTRDGAGEGYNAQPYVTDRTHGAVPGRVTAVGGARTWLTEAPFKQLYICLDGRDVHAEAQTGAPSGAGWHAIGDPAESLLNTLEDAPILVGWAKSQTFARDEWAMAFGDGAPAFELADVATFSLLQPGDALVTGQFDDHAAPVYHWYAVHTPAPLCTEVWVHPCGVDDRESFACRPAPVQFQVHEAHTQLGEDIYLVGDHPALGGWDPAEAVALSPAGYPTWHADVYLPPGTPIEFKFIRKGAQGGVEWMPGPNLRWTVPFAPSATVEATW